jgi:hypothetical protein
MDFAAKTPWFPRRRKRPSERDQLRSRCQAARLLALSQHGYLKIAFFCSRVICVVKYTYVNMLMGKI